MDASTTTRTTSALRHGCVSSSPTASCPPATSTSEVSRTLSPATCAAIASAISSPASADGPTPWLLPDGRLIDPCGLAAALANLSARQVRELGLRTSGISGRPGSISSRSADLQRSLESRLRAGLSGRGSTLYRLTWKEWTTPSGVCRYRLRASVLPRSATGCSGRPRPTAMDSVRQPAPDFATPNLTLNHAAVLSGWPRPTARDWKSASATPEFLAARAAMTRGKPLSEEVFAQLSQNSEAARLTASGELLTGSTAGIDGGGQLNPAHARWLMGYPPAWCASAVTAMQSFPRSRRSSFAPRKK